MVFKCHRLSDLAWGHIYSRYMCPILRKLIVWTPAFEGGMWLDGGSKNRHKKHVSRRDWTTCSKYNNHSRLNIILPSHMVEFNSYI
jgi:hypothetical protein